MTYCSYISSSGMRWQHRDVRMRPYYFSKTALVRTEGEVNSWWTKHVYLLDRAEGYVG